MDSCSALWRRAGEPAAAHDIAEARLDQRAYARTRGVAQQAARLARAERFARDDRRRLLSAAWLHDAGGDGPAVPPVLGVARSLRAAGHERLARVVAHSRNAALAAALAGLPPLAREFPVPAPPDDRVLLMLDIAVVTTSASGARATPAEALRDLVARSDPRATDVRVMVALVARLADSAAARGLVERVAVPTR
ncbi:MAG: hypothetical protein AB7V42_09350 [Thermoleophilia bacterium]